MMVSSIDMGWLSGFIDGEGCFFFYKRKAVSKNGRGFWWRLALVITNTDLRPLQKAKEIIGDGCSISKRSKSTSVGSSVYSMAISANALRRILPQLKLYSKEEQRLLFLDGLKLVEHSKSGKNDILLEAIWQQIRALNGRKRRDGYQ